MCVSHVQRDFYAVKLGATSNNIKWYKYMLFSTIMRIVPTCPLPPSLFHILWFVPAGDGEYNSYVFACVRVTVAC